jgi:hypothetical protein
MPAILQPVVLYDYHYFGSVIAFIAVAATATARRKTNQTPAHAAP